MSNFRTQWATSDSVTARPSSTVWLSGFDNFCRRNEIDESQLNEELAAILYMQLMIPCWPFQIILCCTIQHSTTAQQVGRDTNTPDNNVRTFQSMLTAALGFCHLTLC